MDTELLANRYQIGKQLARGLMAIVYSGRDMHTEKFVALKVLRDHYSADPNFIERFQLGAKAQAAVQHPNIVQVYDLDQDNGQYFMAIELVEGPDLRRYLRERSPIGVERSVTIAREVALGLGAAHRKRIVHCNVMPQNILINRIGEIKLTGFGLGMDAGMKSYASPEQFQGEAVSFASDTYALGVVLYEMLTVHVPFEGDTPVAVAMQHIQDPPPPPSQFNPSIPPDLEALVLRCLEKEPGKRFQDIFEVARALEALR
jgi:eukaryotic-like serine/threonine-protein kinase